MPSNSRTTRALLCSTLLLTAPGAGAAQDSEPYELGTIVLSAAGVGVDPLTAPASVTVVTGEQLANESFTDLTEAVSNVPGVFVDQNDNITFRGLRPEDTLILIDGQRVNTRQSRTNGSGGLDQLYMPPAAAIERIEIVRGPMSSLFGSEALGGVVNIITKPVDETWTGSLTLENTSPQGDADTASRQGSYFLSGPLVADRLGLQLWGRHLQRDQDEAGGSVERDLTDTNAKLSWTPSAGQEVYLKLGRTTTTSETQALRGTSLVSTIREDERNSASLGYEGALGAWDVSALLAREEATRETPTSNVGRTIELGTTTFDIKASREMSWNGLHQVSIGGQYLDSDLSDLNLGSSNTTDPYEFSNSQTSVFFEDMWEATNQLDLTFGARLTDDERFGSKVTPRVYAVYELTPSLFLNGGVSTGYKTPELRDANENYYLPTNGSRSGDAIQGNPDLKPEESTNYEIGLRFDNGTTRATATLFQTDFDNKIDSEFVTAGGAPQGGDLYRYVNVDEVRNRGVELSVGHYLSDELEITGSYTYIDSEQLSGVFAGQPLNRTPSHQASLRLDWQTPAEGFAVWGQANYRGDSSSAAQNRSGGVVITEYDGYSTFDVGANYLINDNVTISAALYNLTDTDINSTNHGSTKNGRTFWIGLTTSF